MGQYWGCLCGSSHLWPPGGVQKGFVWWFPACFGRLLQGVEVFVGCFPMVFLCLLDDFWILFLSWFATVCPCVPKGWLFPACFENCDILLGIIRVTLALPNAKSLFAIEFLTQKWHESKRKGQGGPAAHRFLGISCSNFKQWNWWDMGLHKLWPKTFTQVSKQFQAIKPSHFEDHDIYPTGAMYGIYANIWGILMVNVTTNSIHGSYGIDSENCIPDPCQAVFNCAHQGYFLASALHGGFEALTIAFALRPSAALLRAVQRFLLNSTFDDDLAWNSMGYGPWGCGWVKFQGRAFGG